MNKSPDELLKDWQNKLMLASNRLLELCDRDTYCRLAGVDGLTPIALTGKSARLVNPALAEIKVLWRDLALLSEQIEKATTLRGLDSGWLLTDKMALEIESLLNAPIIDVSGVHSLNANGLLASDNVTAEQLLSHMNEVFERAKQVIMTVDALWLYLPQALSQLNTEVTELQKLSFDLHEDDPRLELASASLAALQMRIECDPVGVRDDLENELRPALIRIRDEMEDLERRCLNVRGELKTARHKCQQLKDVRARSELAYLKSQKAVNNPQNLRAPLKIAVIEDLEQWLKTLEETLAKGRWKAASIGLSKFRLLLDEHLADACRSLQANEAPLETLAELRGRFKSLQAKAKSIEENGGELEPTHLATCAAAEKLLYSIKVPLDQVELLLIRYAAILNSEGGSAT